MFTLILPVHDEAEFLEKTVGSFMSFLKKNTREKFLFIIAENGSTDESYKIALALEKKYRGILVLHTKKRLGKGLTMKRCSNHVKGDVVLYVGCDPKIKLSTLISGIKELRRGVEGPDIIVGSRLNARSYKAKLYMFLAKLLFGIKIGDIQCNFKGFRTAVFRQINKLVKSNGKSWDTEFIIKAIEADYVIWEIPIILEKQDKITWKTFLKLIELRLAKFKR